MMYAPNMQCVMRLAAMLIVSDDALLTIHELPQGCAAIYQYQLRQFITNNIETNNIENCLRR